MLAGEKGSQTNALVQAAINKIVRPAYTLSLVSRNRTFATCIVMLGTLASAESMQNKVQRMLSGVAAVDQPGVAALVRQNGETVFEGGHGLRDLRSRSPLDAHTDFRLASCTKQFTAMAAMLLVHDGRLRYDERLTDIFPEFPAYGTSITVRNLLNHSSGLPDYEELMEKTGGAQKQRWTESNQITDAEALKLLESVRVGRFAPGTRWAYSNSGYVVLGMIVAKVSGLSFPDFLQQRVFKPLRMDDSIAYVKGINTVSNRAYGYSVEGSTLVETDQSSTSATLGDGGIYSNLSDLAKWDDALSRHTLLSDAEMRDALTPARMPGGSLPKWDSGPGDTDPLGGKPVAYGFGWFLDPYQGHERMWHYGETAGFRSAVQRFPKDRLTVIVLSNRSDVSAIDLAMRIAALYLNNTNKSPEP